MDRFWFSVLSAYFLFIKISKGGLLDPQFNVALRDNGASCSSSERFIGCVYAIDGTYSGVWVIGFPVGQWLQINFAMNYAIEFMRTYIGNVGVVELSFSDGSAQQINLTRRDEWQVIKILSTTTDFVKLEILSRVNDNALNFNEIEFLEDYIDATDVTQLAWGANCSSSVVHQIITDCSAAIDDSTDTAWEFTGSPDNEWIFITFDQIYSLVWIEILQSDYYDDRTLDELELYFSDDSTYTVNLTKQAKEQFLFPERRHSSFIQITILSSDVQSVPYTSVQFGVYGNEIEENVTIASQVPAITAVPVPRTTTVATTTTVPNPSIPTRSNFASTTTVADSPDGSLSNTTNIPTNKAKTDDSKDEDYIKIVIISTSILAGLVIICITVCVAVYLNRKRRSDDETRTYEQPQEKPTYVNTPEAAQPDYQELDDGYLEVTADNTGDD